MDYLLYNSELRVRRAVEDAVRRRSNWATITSSALSAPSSPHFARTLYDSNDSIDEQLMGAMGGGGGTLEALIPGFFVGCFSCLLSPL